jgi:hypothetical protein
MSFCKINNRYIFIFFLGIILSLKVYPQDSLLTVEVEIPRYLEINFKNENELIIRAYLVDKNNPGDCFGMPEVKRPFETKIIVNKDLIEKIKKEYNIK